MVDSADIYFIQHVADIYFSKFVCISESRGYPVNLFVFQKAGGIK